MDTGTSRADRAPGFSGLQAQRTGLAWTRTSLGVTANAALLSVRGLKEGNPTIAAVPATFAILIALAVILVGRHRDGVMRRDPLPTPLAPRLAVPIIGWSVVVLALLSGAALLL